MPTDFQNLDATILAGIKRYNEYKSAALLLGYTYLSEMIIDNYYNKQFSARKISRMLSANYYLWIIEFTRNAGLLPRPTGVPLRMISKDDSFVVIDEKLNIRDYAKKLKVAQDIGYNTVSHAVVDMYYEKHLSLDAIGRMFEYSASWVVKMLEKLNMATRRKAGGRTYLKVSDKLREKILCDMRLIEPTWANIRNYLNINNISISPKTVQRLVKENAIWKGVTNV